ncbi:MAG TPA: hypothetical protein VF173_32230 [Thermoanaerobaculia bacterium]|nr:hypothetical protein [Thermoanaerobaculia bacterium]
MRFFKTLLSQPYSVPALAALAALAALIVGYQTSHHRPPSPLEILRQDTLDTSYKPGYWTAVAREQPDLYQSALLYCVAHSLRPNCDALRQQAFTTSLERSAIAATPASAATSPTTAPGPLQLPAVPLPPSPTPARPR